MCWEIIEWVAWGKSICVCYVSGCQIGEQRSRSPCLFVASGLQVKILDLHQGLAEMLLGKGGRIEHTPVNDGKAGLVKGDFWFQTPWRLFLNVRLSFWDITPID